MMSPMPFCPSLEPWKKLTPVQVSTSRPRIQKGGGSVPCGRFVELLVFDKGLADEQQKRRHAEADDAAKAAATCRRSWPVPSPRRWCRSPRTSIGWRCRRR